MSKAATELMMKLTMLTKVLTHSSTHPLTHSLTHSSTHPLIHSFTYFVILPLHEIDENGEIDLEATAAIDFGGHNHHEFMMNEDSMDVNLMQTNSLMTAPHIY